jgi:hypothetical protein
VHRYNAALDAALERLLAGERTAASAYVDRNLLAGGVLVLTGPMSVGLSLPGDVRLVIWTVLVVIN